MKVAFILALTAATVVAQPATRRPTNIGALIAYPSFYHNRPILIVGKVETTDKGMRISELLREKSTDG